LWLSNVLVNSQAIARALVVIVVELCATALVFGVAYVAMNRILQGTAARRARTLVGERGHAFRRTRNILLAAFAVVAVGIVGYNGWLVTEGVDVPQHTSHLLLSLTLEAWRALAVALGKVGLAVLGFVVARRVIGGVLDGVHAGMTQRQRLGDAKEGLAQLFARLDRAVVVSGWILIAALTSWLLGLPQPVTNSLLLLVRLYLVFAVGVMLIRAAAIVIDVFDRWGREYSQEHRWGERYEPLRRLVPTLRACVEYALWITIAALVIAQLGPISDFATWGPRLVQAIGIFFVGRVIIEVGYLEIGHRMLPSDGVDEMERRRRATMVPLVRSIFTYAVYFASAALMLSSLGFNPMPFLAGAGILGLVVGFGAQSLINDVVSGFFILFENVYLVGDLIEAAGAKGIVEAIEFRVTKIRDADGRVHIIRNGDMKPVINYSKDYTMAVVPVEVAYDRDLRAVFAALLEAGARVRAGNANVLAETQIDGITNLGVATMTVRTSTRVKPGSHDAIAAALRLAIKEAFDQRSTLSAPRTSLVPESVRDFPGSLRRR
jgi:small-conductance mechanosensitive channel